MDGRVRPRIPSREPGPAGAVKEKVPRPASVSHCFKRTEPQPGWMPASRKVWTAPIAALLLATLLLLPSVGAFSTREDPVSIAYERGRTPIVFATGAIDLKGEARGGLLATGAEGFLLEHVPDITVTERLADGTGRNTTFRGADLVVHAGTIMWSFPDGGVLDVDFRAPYGLGLALPRLPIALTEEGDGAGALLAAPDIQGAFSWRGGTSRLQLLDAEASILDASGSPVQGWDRRQVNAGTSPTSELADFSVVFTLGGGPFEGAPKARIVGVALGASNDLRLSVAPAAQDRFSETLDVLGELGELAGDREGAQVLGADNPLRQLEPFSGVLNGALVVSDGGGGDANATVAPVESTIGGDPFDVGPLALLRGEMGLAWSGERMSVQGTPTLAISREGFAVDEPARVGFVPLLALVLWGVALAAIVVFFVKRPPQGAEAGFAMRIVAFVLHVAVLLAAFWWWDVSFARTFGTSFLTLLAEGGGMDDLARLGFVFAIETLPWGLAALCFALPVRIAGGIALRYLGQGKALKGFAKAAGFVALALLGPVYALWLVNTMIDVLLPLMGSALT